MTRNPMIYFSIAGLVLPLIWLAATTDFSEGPGGVIVLIGAVISYIWLSRTLWVAHRRGRFAPHGCATCGSPMSALAPGALKPTRDTLPVPQHGWVCRRCGRLA